MMDAALKCGLYEPPPKVALKQAVRFVRADGVEVPATVEKVYPILGGSRLPYVDLTYRGADGFFGVSLMVAPAPAAAVLPGRYRLTDDDRHAV